MPYCTNCGTQVLASDRFCRSCGAKQPAAGASEQSPPGGGTPAAVPGGPALSPRAASTLCYIPWLGWIAALYVLASEQFRTLRQVRFHAYQGLYLFVAWLLVDWAIGPWFHMMPGPAIPVDSILQILILIVWIMMLIKTSKGQRYSLPILGELAERSL